MKIFLFSKSFFLCPRRESNSHIFTDGRFWVCWVYHSPTWAYNWEQKDFRSHLLEISLWWHSPSPGCVTKKLHLYYTSFLPQFIQESIMEAPTLDSQYNSYSYVFQWTNNTNITKIFLLYKQIWNIFVLPTRLELVFPPWEGDCLAS